MIAPVELVLFKPEMIMLVPKELPALFLPIPISARPEGFGSGCEVVETAMALAAVVAVVEKMEDGAVTSDEAGEGMMGKTWLDRPSVGAETGKELEDRTLLMTEAPLEEEVGEEFTIFLKELLVKMLLVFAGSCLS